MRIVHITPHLGAGIGAAYSGITKPEGNAASVEHVVLLLEKPAKPVFVERVRAHGAAVRIEPDRAELERMLRDADIVQLNWWQHPAISEFLYSFPDIPVRLLGWLHNSGLTYPYLRGAFLERFAKTLFTTPFTYEHPDIAAWSRAEREQRCAVVYGMSDVSRFFTVKPRPHAGFRIGYLGTLDFSKLRPDFVDFCAAASEVAEDVRFTLIGDDDNRAEILRQAKSYEIDDRFEFRGFRENVADEYARLDCLGYLLNPDHFGATENVMLEAMAAGLPVIAMNQCTEKYIVRHAETGFLVDDRSAYRDAIRCLYDQKEERDRLGGNARAVIASHYSLAENNAVLRRIYRETLSAPKTVPFFRDLLGPEPADWFLYFVGKERPLFSGNRIEELGRVFRSESKGSVHQFARRFPGDVRLREWSERLRKNDS